MIYHLKKNLRLLAYGFQFVPCIVGAIFIELLAILYLGISMYFMSDFSVELHSTNALLLVCAAMLLQLAPLMIVQVEASLEVSGIILSSRLRKTMGVYFPDMICIVGMVQAVLLLVVVSTIFGNNAVLGELIFLSGIIFLIILVYMTVAYRYFMTGMVIYLAGYLLITVFASYIFSDISEDTVLHGRTGILLGILVMIAGLALSSFMRRHLYKKPIAKYSVSKKLRRYM